MNTNKNNTAKLTNRIAITIKEGKRPTVYDQITDRIIAMLEAGTVPWQKPWKVATGLPRNLISKKPYRGINTLLLHSMSYESPFWLTFHQAQQLGGMVRKGERACPVVFGKRVKEQDEQTGEETGYTVLRLYSVFNLSQIQGLKNIPATVETPATVSTPAEDIIALMPKRPEIKYGMSKAIIRPALTSLPCPTAPDSTVKPSFSARFTMK